MGHFSRIRPSPGFCDAGSRINHCRDKGSFFIGRRPALIFTRSLFIFPRERRRAAGARMRMGREWIMSGGGALLREGGRSFKSVQINVLLSFCSP
ncbi:hypothetical protein CEXT_613811 [Caerostris extrusa]|uniref:Ycf15 n=1 Tax=Caerostris extrusa TaxID=172846 RepID=A0AAV4NCB4_CAEEX|nr:hypothetical protein CEXT_613811 [Caerostris extrusa]